MNRSLFIGRFQPYHNGHNSVVNRIYKRSNKVIVGIGGTEVNYTSKNPFTMGERIQMIKNTIGFDHKNLYVIPIHNIENNALWPSHVDKITPEFDTVFTANDLVYTLFNDGGYNVKHVDLIDRDQLSGTNIRENIRNNKQWRHLVPDSVIEIIDEIDGVSRIKSLQNQY